MAPMLAEPAPALPAGMAGLLTAKGGGSAGEWLLERKFDGFRCLAVKAAGVATLWSRNRLPYTERFPEVGAAVAALPVDDVVLDGEVVAADGEGRGGLDGLHAPGARRSLVVFDILRLLGHPTTDRPLEERRALVAALLAEAPPGLVASEEVDLPLPEALAWACAQGWEGLVAKRRGSPYRSGRSSYWRKLKCVSTAEMVVGGWTDPQRGSRGFGALLVGYHDEEGLRYAGRVGGGFGDATLARLDALLAEREMDRPPFVDAPPGSGYHWVRPELVIAVAFSEWTSAGRLRHPRFAGLRPGVEPAGVTRHR